MGVHAAVFSLWWLILSSFHRSKLASSVQSSTRVRSCMRNWRSTKNLEVKPCPLNSEYSILQGARETTTHWLRVFQHEPLRSDPDR